ncbi:MAG: DNA repair protein RadC [Chloroflexi bacterium]|nr:DNA repair protein RadC [Chloroflexota bacterium]
MIRDLPPGERPRERLRDRGAAYLSNAELLAIVLRTGSSTESVLNLAGRLLAQFHGLEGLAAASYPELCGVRGLGDAKASQLKAALELGRRLVTLQAEARVTITCPQDVANLLSAEMGLLENEHLRVVLLDTKNHVVGTPEVYRGSVNSTTVRVAEVFREAVRHNCPAIIAVHNHPSGDPAPSPEDVQVTRQLIDGGKALDITLLDHVIIGRQQFASLKEKGLAFS